jgi:hypothetical protein
MRVGLGPCKGKDTASTLGPWLVTPDELAPYRDADGFLRLALAAAVNGDVVGRDLLSNMSWTFQAMIAYARGAAGSGPGTCSARGPAATAAAWVSCGGGGASRCRRRCGPGTRSR